jgi:acetyl esterase/lipase
MTDVCDAYAWAQTHLQSIVSSKGILIDEKRIVVIGWSSGGHLAMTIAWKSKEAGLTPPTAVLSFYGPTDFESGGENPMYLHLGVANFFTEDLDDRQTELYPEQRSSLHEIISSLPKKPVSTIA